MFIPQMTDASVTAMSMVAVAVITIVPSTLAAVWSHKGNTKAKESLSKAEETLHEVKANGGMDGPDPTMKDYIKHLSKEQAQLKKAFEAHMVHSKVMDQALAQVYLALNPDVAEHFRIEPTDK